MPERSGLQRGAGGILLISHHFIAVVARNCIDWFASKTKQHEQRCCANNVGVIVCRVLLQNIIRNLVLLAVLWTIGCLVCLPLGDPVCAATLIFVCFCFHLAFISLVVCLFVCLRVCVFLFVCLLVCVFVQLLLSNEEGKEGRQHVTDHSILLYSDCQQCLAFVFLQALVFLFDPHVWFALIHSCGMWL